MTFLLSTPRYVPHILTAFKIPARKLRHNVVIAHLRTSRGRDCLHGARLPGPRPLSSLLAPSFASSCQTGRGLDRNTSSEKYQHWEGPLQVGLLASSSRPVSVSVSRNIMLMISVIIYLLRLKNQSRPIICFKTAENEAAFSPRLLCISFSLFCFLCPGD